jgi:hypothetical protein
MMRQASPERMLLVGIVCLVGTVILFAVMHWPLMWFYIGLGALALILIISTIVTVRINRRNPK